MPTPAVTNHPVPVAEWLPAARASSTAIYAGARELFISGFMLLLTLVTAALALLAGGDFGMSMMAIFYSVTGCGLTLQAAYSTATRADLSLVDEPDDPLEKMVRLRIVRGNTAIGQDSGVARIDEESLCFVGQRTSFCIGAADLDETGRGGPAVRLNPLDGGLLLHLKHPEGNVVLALRPLRNPSVKTPESFTYSDVVPSNVHHRFVKAAMALNLASRSSGIQRVFPPLRPIAGTKTRITRQEMAVLGAAALVGAGAGLAIFSRVDFVVICAAIPIHLVFLTRAILGFRRRLE